MPKIDTKHLLANQTSDTSGLFLRYRNSYYIGSRQIGSLLQSLHYCIRLLWWSISILQNAHSKRPCFSFNGYGAPVCLSPDVRAVFWKRAVLRSFSDYLVGKGLWFIYYWAGYFLVAVDGIDRLLVWFVTDFEKVNQRSIYAFFDLCHNYLSSWFSTWQ